MSHKLNNNFDTVQLLSLKQLEMAAEIPGRDPRGPYVVMQHAYDPDDPTMTPMDFLLGRSGAWLATGWFIGLPIAERRKEFVFATVSEVIQLMENLPGKIVITRPTDTAATEPPADDPLNRLIRGNP